MQGDIVAIASAGIGRNVPRLHWPNTSGSVQSL